MGVVAMLNCDRCKHVSDTDNPVAFREWVWDGQPVEGEYCARCWGPVAEAVARLMEVARPAPTDEERAEEDKTKARRWSRLNHIELGRGQTPQSVVRAWRANDPSLAKDRYIGDGEPPSQGVMPPDLQPRDWPGNDPLPNRAPAAVNGVSP